MCSFIFLHLVEGNLSRQLSNLSLEQGDREDEERIHVRSSSVALSEISRPNLLDSFFEEDKQHATMRKKSKHTSAFLEKAQTTADVEDSYGSDLQGLKENISDKPKRYRKLKRKWEGVKNEKKAKPTITSLKRNPISKMEFRLLHKRTDQTEAEDLWMSRMLNMSLNYSKSKKSKRSKKIKKSKNQKVQKYKDLNAQSWKE